MKLTNLEILNSLKDMSTGYCSRFLGIAERQLDTFLRLFKMWIQRYTDGFNSIIEAVKNFKKAYSGLAKSA